MFSGSIVALVTPMTGSGDVDWSALEHLVGWHLDQGTHGIVPVGTTGESATLDIDEHLAVIKRTVELVAGKIPVIAGTGANSTSEAIHQTQAAQKFGVDACLSVTPYYNRPTQEGLVAHYEAIAKATDVPIVLYNVPPRTACDMSADTVARLAPIQNIVGIKEACGDAERVGDIFNKVDADFLVLSGEDAQTLRMMEQGAKGTISVTANVLPGAMADFVGSYLSGNIEQAQSLDKRLQPVHEILFVESSPTPTKWALHDMQRIGPGIRLPLLPLSERHHAEVRSRLKTAGADFSGGAA